MHLGFVEMFGKLKCWKISVYCRNSCSWYVNIVNRLIVNKIVSLVAVEKDGEKDKIIGKIKTCEGNKQFVVSSMFRYVVNLKFWM